MAEVITLPIDIVQNDEHLYRRVLPERWQFSIDNTTGRKVVSAQAFSDSTCQVSVDRANLCGNDPSFTQRTSKDGVVALITGEVRAIESVVLNNKNGELLRTQVVEVNPDPIEEDEVNLIAENKAHALIIANPDFDHRKVFKKLIERLCILAQQQEWLIEPQE